MTDLDNPVTVSKDTSTERSRSIASIICPIGARGEDKIHIGQTEGDTTIGRRKHTVAG